MVFFLYMYIVDCVNICKNGGVVMKGSSGCFCKCFFGLKGSDCFEFDISDGMFKVYCKWIFIIFMFFKYYIYFF